MAKYKLTVKYQGICDLSIAGDIPDIIANEFDQYVKSILYKKEDWENFETNFKEAARLEYSHLNAQKKTEEATETAQEEVSEKTAETEEPKEQIQEQPPEETETAETLEEVDVTLEEVQPKLSELPKDMILSFEDYIKNKNINTPLDEFVVGACYLSEILDLKEFSLKQLNSKLYPAFGHLADSETIEEAVTRVLIEETKDGASTRYIINQNAWNYHNYDLVRR